MNFVEQSTALKLKIEFVWNSLKQSTEATKWKRSWNRSETHRVSSLKRNQLHKLFLTLKLKRSNLMISLSSNSRTSPLNRKSKSHWLSRSNSKPHWTSTLSLQSHCNSLKTPKRLLKTPICLRLNYSALAESPTQNRVDTQLKRNPSTNPQFKWSSNTISFKRINHSNWSSRMKVCLPHKLFLEQVSITNLIK